MVLIFDGEDTATSRLKLTTSIDKDSDIARIDGKKQSIQDIQDALSNTSLFASKKTIVIEYFSKLKPQAQLFKLIAPFIKDKNTTILLWDGLSNKSREAASLGIINYTFDFPKLFYTFLDGLVPKSSKRNTLLIHEILKNMTPEQVFFALTKRVRQLLYMKGRNFQELSEFKKMASWQISKLQKQAAFWEERELKDFLVKLATIDESIKTSALALPLAKHLDILLLTTLN